VTNGNYILNYCVASPPGADFHRNSDLVARMAELRRSLEEKRRQCAPPVQRDTSVDRAKREGGRIGAVNVILTWNTRDDLDLHVNCPNGDEIFFRQKTNCGGELDVDKNANSRNLTTTPVENVTWPENAAPPGTYRVEVNPYNFNPPVEFKVVLTIGGREVKVQNGRFERGASRLFIFEFTLPYTASP
jgi:hypothetical protein